jgi:hypothetical protein
MYVIDQLCHQLLTIVSHQFEYILRYICCRLLEPTLIDSFLHFIMQDIRAFLVFIYFPFGFSFQVFGQLPQSQSSVI